MPFAGSGSKVQLSTNLGQTNRDLLPWRGDGKEIYFMQDIPASSGRPNARVVAAEVDGSSNTFRVGATRPLFDVRVNETTYRNFSPGAPIDVTRDGQRFLVAVLTQDPQPSPLTVITDWSSLLRR